VKNSVVVTILLATRKHLA